MINIYFMFNLKDIAIYVTILLLGFIITYSGYFNIIELGNNKDKYLDNYSKNYNSLNFYLITSSNCSFSNSINLFSAVSDIQNKLKTESKILNLNFKSIAISVDDDIEASLTHIKHFGNYNELISGVNWDSITINSIINYLGLEKSTPQLLLTYHEINDDLGDAISVNVLNVRGADRIIVLNKNDSILSESFIEYLNQTKQ